RRAVWGRGPPRPRRATRKSPRNDARRSGGGGRASPGRAQAYRSGKRLLRSLACRTRALSPWRACAPPAERAEILSSLREVDHVVVFEEDTADRLIASLRPDVHAKGTDYGPGTVPEEATVRAVGGRVAFVGDPKDHSTRDLITQVLERFR